MAGWHFLPKARKPRVEHPTRKISSKTFRRILILTHSCYHCPAETHKGKGSERGQSHTERGQSHISTYFSCFSPLAGRILRHGSQTARGISRRHLSRDEPRRPPRTDLQGRYGPETLRRNFAAKRNKSVLPLPGVAFFVRLFEVNNGQPTVECSVQRYNANVGISRNRS